MNRHRHVITEAVVEDGDGEPVGLIKRVRHNNLDPGRYRWQMGVMNRIPSPSVEASGTCPTYEEAKAALDEALANRTVGLRV